MRFTGFIWLVWIPLMLPAQAAAGACVPQKEIIKGIDDANTGNDKQAGDNADSDASKIIRYLCSANPGEVPTLRIGFYRLDEALGGSIVTATPLPELQAALGAFETVDTDVTAEARTIFQQFGSKTDYDFALSDVSWHIALSGVRLAESTAADDTSDTRKPKKSAARPSQLRHIWYLSSNSFAMTSSILILKEIGNTMLNTNRWPAGYKFLYGPCDDVVSCTTIWRYITVADFDLLLQDMREFVAAGGTKGMTAAPPASRIVPDYERSFQLDRYLGTNGLPPDFLSIYSIVSEGCLGSGWSFTYLGRPLTIDVAVVENLTDRPVRIDDFRGLKNSAKTLRPVNGAGAQSIDNPTSLGLPPQTLAPHAKLALPVRIRFGYPAQRDWDLDTAKATYEKIRSSKSNLLESTIQITPKKSITLRKSRDSFGAPEAPAVTEYVFGPEISLGGLVADGKEFALQREPEKAATSADDAATSDVGEFAMFVYVGPEGGSCPVLYLQDEASGSWIALGKVLHQAQGADNEMTEVIRLPYLRTHFRLTEEEPEVSYIKNAVLRLTLKNERRIDVPSRQASSRVIPAYASIDMDFDLPSGVAADEVVASELVLTGYYERYNQMLPQVGASRTR